MPLDLPGAPLGRLPDAHLKGYCPNCGRPFRKLKVRETSEGSHDYLCPFCDYVIERVSTKRASTEIVKLLNSLLNKEQDNSEDVNKFETLISEN